MKKFNKFFKPSLLSIMGMLTFGSVQLAMAQIPAAVPETDFGGAQNGIINTGCDAVGIGISGSTLAVSVWDGPNAGIGWEDVNSGATGVIPFQMDIKDPDVAFGYGGDCFAVVYIFRQDVFLEVYKYASGTMVPVTGPLMISNGGGNNCKVPNIDTGVDGLGAIVWGEDVPGTGTRNIFTRGIDVCNVGLAPIVNLSGPYSSGGPGEIQADVSVSNEGSQEFINYTYISFDGVTQRVIHQVEDTGAIFSGSVGTMFLNNVVSSNVPATGVFFQKPRIAGRYGTGLAPAESSSITFQETDLGASQDHIWVYNATGGLFNLTSYNNTNKNPVIDWTKEEEYIVAWEDQGQNIYSLKLNPVGVPIPNTSSPVNYQRLNQGSGNNYAPSIATRFMNSNTIMSCFANQATSGLNRLKYKFSQTGNTQFFREAASDVATGIHVYPNPAADMINIEGMELESVQLVSVTGQVVRALSGAELNGKAQLNVTDLASGVYLLKVNAGTQSYTERVIVE